MINEVPFYVDLLFILTTFLTLFFLWQGSRKSKAVLFISLSWLLITGLGAFTGFYTDFNAMPPRFFLIVGPAMITILMLFLLPSGRAWLDKFDSGRLTLLHSVRFPVELVLFALFTYKAVPELMTFEGRNLDIISGLTAPIIFYFGYVRKQLNRTVLILWNFMCLALLVNIVTHAILAAPTPFQQIAFDQPNTGVFYFPYVWLPGFVVPAVLLSQLVSLRQLFFSSVIETNSELNGKEIRGIRH